MQKYYLAYGSNLNLDAMRFRCPSATKVGVYYLSGYSLQFRYYLTIVRDEKSVVPLGVFLIEKKRKYFLMNTKDILLYIEKRLLILL